MVHLSKKIILLGTSNPAKIAEIVKFLEDLPIKFITLKEANIVQKPEENSESFAGNAIKKALFYAKISGLPVIADDGGLEIDVLHGAPGVKSHRWAGYSGEHTKSEDEKLIQFTLKSLNGVPIAERKAMMRLVLALALPNGKVFRSQGMIKGIIALAPSKKRTLGFPYRSIFFIPEINKYYDQAFLTEEENRKYNHRYKALIKLRKIITGHL